MLKLYYCHKSYASQKVRLYLAEKNIPWEGHHIDLLTQEHLTDEYIKINPRGLVPALDDNGKIILNSTDIMRYIEDNYVEKSLSHPRFDNEIYAFSKRDEDLHDPHIRTLSYHYLWMANNRSAEEINRVLELAKRHPDKARGDFLARAVQKQITEKEILIAKQEIIAALDEMEGLLKTSQSDFLYGNEYTIADAVGTAKLCRLQLLGFSSAISRCQLVSIYYERMLQRPSFTTFNSLH